MTPTPESASIAYHNGILCENMLKEKLPEFEYLGEEIDGILTFNGKPAEVKSCQRTINSYTGERSGRFWFKGSQHDELIENDGVYILLVHEGEKVVSTRIIKASLLFPQFQGAKTVSWPALFDRISISTETAPRVARTA